MPRNTWWSSGVIYNIYPRSFRDSNGDGIGDLRGIVDKLDYLQWLGVDGIWLNPITPSPNRDWGYDVTDYRGVHPDLGTLADADALIAGARDRGIAIVLDIVPSHTSDLHPWFIDARSSKQSRYRDYYVWRPPGPGGAAPNNWQSSFEGSSWEFDAASGEYYMHTFMPQQPQLNWWNPQVRAEFEDILRFWFDRGVAGLRIDAVQALVYDREFRDNPPAGPNDSRREQEVGQQFLFNGNRPETHDIFRSWRVLADRYDPPRLLFGETWFTSLEKMAVFYGNGGDELDLGWNVPFLQAAFTAPAVRDVVERTLAVLPAAARSSWAMSTHDYEGRATDRWCGGDSGRIRCALLLLLTLPGTPILYYGDEIGMTAPLPDRLRGIVRDRAKADASRDATRTPMQWDDSAQAGFTTAADPWLPVGDAALANVAAQAADPASTLSFVRDLLALRRRFSSLASGAFTFMPAPDGVLAWTRDDVIVAINIGSAERTVDVAGTIVLGTNRARDGERVQALQLRANDGAVVLP